MGLKMVKEVTVQKDGKETIIKCLPPKGRDTKKGLKMLMKAQSSEEAEAGERMNEYLDFLDEMASRYTGLSIEELDDLTSEDKDKILLVYQDGVASKIDFLRSSLKRVS